MPAATRRVGRRGQRAWNNESGAWDFVGPAATKLDSRQALGKGTANVARHSRKTWNLESEEWEEATTATEARSNSDRVSRSKRPRVWNDESEAWEEASQAQANAEASDVQREEQKKKAWNSEAESWEASTGGDGNAVLWKVENVSTEDARTRVRMIEQDELMRGRSNSDRVSASRHAGVWNEESEEWKEAIPAEVQAEQKSKTWNPETESWDLAGTWQGGGLDIVQWKVENVSTEDARACVRMIEQDEMMRK